MSAAALRWFTRHPERLGESLPYGARELQRLHARHLLQALTISSLFGVAVALLLAQNSYLWRQGPIVAVPPVDDLRPPTEILTTLRTPSPPPPPSGPTPIAGLPVAVSDALQDTSLVFAPEPGLLAGPGVPGNEDPGASIPNGGGGGMGEEPAPDPNEWRYYEELPVPVTRVAPDYPDIAKRAGVEGLVTVRALVGRDGRVQDILVVGSPTIFDEEASRAVRLWVFTPAKSNGRPVRAWVAVPVRFELR